MWHWESRKCQGKLALGLGSPEGEGKEDDNGWERGQRVEKGRAKGSSASGTRDCVTEPWRRPTRITARGTHDGVQAITKPLATFTMQY